ncbi:Saccharopine dehydrogenase [Blyttiomyces sp. JEL0837]|nr:Saccharopine dehydrogenase [Blyttiomyces sp. JEL0837]
MLHFWLRAETKPNEHRTALTPSVAKTLISEGAKVTVERSSQSIFDEKDYVEVGATLVEAGSWRTAPADAYVIGLKELPENDDTPLTNTHIMFAHCFKQQAGWREMLSRFERGNGTLLDLEFLNDDRGRRVAAFGYHAGYAGSAIGIDLWCHQQLRSSDSEVYPTITSFNNAQDLIAHVKSRLQAASAKANGRLPDVMVMGALGRCGTGAVDFARHVGIPEEKIIKWDMAETREGGPFKTILEHEVFVNCIYLSAKIPPFLTHEMVSQTGRTLSVIVDVSCDVTNPNNPIPLYNINTTFDNPVLTIPCGSAAPLDIVTIDHLPTLLPRESSEAFCNDLLPTLRTLKDRSASRVWGDAEELFRQKLAESHAEVPSVVKA